MNESIYDTELQNINELTWLPWIGENYAGLASDKKILLIGESHYYKDGESNHDKIPLFTRGIITRVINSRTTDDHQNWKLFINAIRLLLPGQSILEEQERKLWSNIAFYNFVQNSVKEGTRPSPNNFKEGWSPFFKLIKVIKPSVCIFLGTTSAQTFSKAIQDLGLININIVKDKLINGAWARSGKFKDSDNNNIELVFVKHPSSRFSNNLWREQIEKKISSQLEWLNNAINN